MLVGQRARHSEALRQRQIVGDAGKERVPVLGSSLQMVQPVAYVGDGAIQVDDGNRQPVGHRTAHPGARTSQPKPSTPR